MNKQSIITILLTVLMSMTGAKAFAHDIEVANSDGVTIYYVWTNNKTELAVSYRGSYVSSYSDYYSGNVVIPSSVVYNGNTYSVTSIGNYAFQKCRLTSVTIPNSVTSIGGSAFEYCWLTSVTIGNSVTSIGGSAFKNCSGLTSITIPNSVTSIGQEAFYKCSSLTSVTIPNSVTSIGSSAFYGTAWYNNQPDGLVYAGNVAYNYKGGMPANTKITIKDGTLGIAGDAFRGCSFLTSVTIPSSVTSIGEQAFNGCIRLTSVTIGNSVKSIGEYAFRGCIGLTTVTIPNSVTSIGKGAFYNCKSLTSVTIGNSVTSIGVGAFRDCSGLTSVTIPNSVTSIGEHAFYGCSGLISITIPNSVTSIGQRAFYNCSSLTSVNISDLAAWCNIKFSGSDSNPLYFAHHLYINGNEITNLVIPNSVTSIGGSAFYECSGLTSVTIPNSVTSIGNRAFYGCSGLKDVYIMRDKANINISSDAFNNMDAITLHVKDYAIESFKSTSPWKDFKKIVCDEKVTDFNLTYYVDGEVYKTETHKYDDEIIPEAAPTKKGMTFSGWSIIPKKMPGKDLSVTGSFSWSKLTKDGVVYQVYDGDNQLAKVVGKENVGENINIASPIDIDGYSFSVTTISDNVFKGCASAKSISIPATITKIGERAFANIDHLTDVTIYAKNVPETDRTAFENSYIEDYVTLHVPAGSDDIYKAVAPWKNFKSIDAIEGTKEVPAPEIIVEKGEVTFTCEEEGVTFHYEVTPLGQDAGKANKITLGQSYKIKVYASKEGCQDSEIVTKEVSIKKGDLNLDGKVDVADHVELSKIILEQGQ